VNSLFGFLVVLCLIAAVWSIAAALFWVLLIAVLILLIFGGACAIWDALGGPQTPSSATSSEVHPLSATESEALKRRLKKRHEDEKELYDRLAQ
jgi:hypothetical protein